MRLLAPVTSILAMAVSYLHSGFTDLLLLYNPIGLVCLQECLKHLNRWEHSVSEISEKRPPVKEAYRLQ